jgi:hypothetical protein
VSTDSRGHNRLPQCNSAIVCGNLLMAENCKIPIFERVNQSGQKDRVLKNATAQNDPFQIPIFSYDRA